MCVIWELIDIKAKSMLFELVNWLSFFVLKVGSRTRVFVEKLSDAIAVGSRIHCLIVKLLVHVGVIPPTFSLYLFDFPIPTNKCIK